MLINVRVEVPDGTPADEIFHFLDLFEIEADELKPGFEAEVSDADWVDDDGNTYYWHEE